MHRYLYKPKPPFGILTGAGRNRGRLCWRATGQGISPWGSSRRWETGAEGCLRSSLSSSLIGLKDPLMPQKTHPKSCHLAISFGASPGVRRNRGFPSVILGY